MAPRNLGPRPNLTCEGCLVQPLKIPQELQNSADWHVGLNPFDRVHCHQTLASVRRYTHFKPLPGIIPEDALDITLSAQYDHGCHQFGEKVDVVLQGTTVGIDKRRRLRNTVLAPDEACRKQISFINQNIQKKQLGFEGSTFGSAAESPHQIKKSARGKKQKFVYNEYHVVLIGGITERRHPSNIKLMNSSHHSSLTNAGYSRKDRDGSIYQY